MAIHLMVTFAVHAFEDVWIWLTFLGGQTIHFLVFYVVPCFFSVVFGIVSFIVLSAPGDMRMTTKYRMPPLPTVLTLWNTWIHVGIFDGSNESSNVEVTIDNVLCQKTALGISDVHPDHCHV